MTFHKIAARVLIHAAAVLAPAFVYADQAEFPALAPLAGITHKEILDVGNTRREQMAALGALEKAADEEMQKALGDFSVLRNPGEMQKIAPSAIAAVRKRAQCELERQAYAGFSKDNKASSAPTNLVAHSTEQTAEGPTWHASLLCALGDTEGRNQLAGYWDLPADSIDTMAAFLKADAGKQSELVDSLRKRVSDDDKDPVPASVASAIFKWKLAASPEVGEKAIEVLRASKSPLAMVYVNQIENKKRVEATRNLIGQPLAIAGQLANGKLFSSEDLKGKVILIDFWATWCGPCVAELPRMKKLYAQYHDQGLEIVGVSNDYSSEALQKFLALNTDLTWPQLFDPTAAMMQEMNPISKKFGVNLIPTLYAIDRNGVLRSMTARKDLETLIPTLLAEPVK